jgi:8-oxo-dGTP diphosphatase
VVGVGGVVVHEGRVLLIRRGKEPLKGRWVIPGGTLELGETLEAGVAREIREETGIRVAPVEFVDVFDRIDRQDGTIRFHYVIVDYLCTYLGGTACAASDAEAVVWASREELDDFDLPAKVRVLVEGAFRRAGLAAGPGPG